MQENAPHHSETDSGPASLVESKPIGEQLSIWTIAGQEDVRGTIPLAEEDAARPRVLRRDELLARPRYPNFKLPGAPMGGYGRVAYTGLRASNAQMGMLYVPVGQGSPMHSAGTEHLIMVVEGEMIFTVGDDELRVGPWDQIFLPAGRLYSYRNGGSVPAWFCNVVARHIDWPGQRGRYEVDDRAGDEATGDDSGVTGEGAER